MVDEESPAAVPIEVRRVDLTDSVLVHPNPFGLIARAAGSTAALALTSLVMATLAILNVEAADDLANAKLYHSRGFNTLAQIRWAAGTRLIVAGVALLLALIAGIRYARDLPATRFTFSDDGEEPTESTEGSEAPGWVTLLVGSSVVVSGLSIVLNAVALAVAMHLHESPNFGLTTG